MDFHTYDGAPTTPTPIPAYAGGALYEPMVGSRPLSDIREITEPSLRGTVNRNTIYNQDLNENRPFRSGSLRGDRHDQSPSLRVESRQRRPSVSHHSRRKSIPGWGNPALQPRPGSENAHYSPPKPPGSDSDGSSAFSVPLQEVPRRSSSTNRRRPSNTYVRRAGSVPPVQHRVAAVSNRSQSKSPVKEAVSRLDQDAGIRRRVPSKTIIKKDTPATTDVLDHPSHQHPRLKVDLQISAPLFVGGSSVEGVVRIVVDEAERTRYRKSLTLERLCVDLLGVEELSGVKRHVFLALGNELVDLGHPPPSYMVESTDPIPPSRRSWILVPSVSKLPFLLTLPLEVGPPPFQSKHARIRYVLCASLTIKDAGRQLSVRSSQDTSILSVYDRKSPFLTSFIVF